jgi:uncharacterized membrane protein
MAETEIQEMSIPIIGLMKGVWVMTIGAFAFIGTAFVFTYALIDPSFDLLAKALLGSLLAATIFGAMFGVSRYFTEEQIKYTVINMKLK